ncbi:uncharacterized protein I206_100440 [Kwoniella pini CBS 10737]|uniref:Uncharacterized protein n=1 Tax=Kwoniella pini CBS 10737 TaxID=1296096 RepID=A0A1B9ID79_9TREE|nr:uncharacterized protein I206_00887 [Kwoniella pini CBS 10737]OCF53582.1 hypothetical protein I206_00887 [Kwoniella pini CBS 10737]
MKSKTSIRKKSVTIPNQIKSDKQKPTRSPNLKVERIHPRTIKSSIKATRPEPLLLKTPLIKQYVKTRAELPIGLPRSKLVETSCLPDESLKRARFSPKSISNNVSSKYHVSGILNFSNTGAKSEESSQHPQTMVSGDKPKLEEPLGEIESVIPLCAEQSTNPNKQIKLDQNRFLEDRTKSSESSFKSNTISPIKREKIDSQMIEASLNSQKMITNQQEMIKVQFSNSNTTLKYLKESQEILKKHQENHDWLKKMIWG